MNAVARRRRSGHSTRVTRVTTVLFAIVVLIAAVVVVTRTGGAPAAAARGTAGSTVATGGSGGSAGTDTGVATPVHWPAAVFLGDSWTAGNSMGGKGAANYSAILAAQNRWYASNFSYGGTSYHLGSPDQQFASASHLRSLTAADPDVVFVVNGVNDIDRVTLTAWRNNAAATYDAIHAAAPSAMLVVVGPIAPGPAAKIPGYAAWNTALAEVAAAHDAVYVDAYAEDWFGGRAASYIGSDGFHPDDAGQAYLATRLQADLVRLGVVADLEKTRDAA